MGRKKKEKKDVDNFRIYRLRGIIGNVEELYDNTPDADLPMRTALMDTKRCAMRALHFEIARREGLMS